jgi:hypothetical protein
MAPNPQTAVILKFPRVSDAGHRLLPSDKAEACQWELTAIAYGFDRIVIHEQMSGDGPEDGDFVLIYRMGDRWARWGAARQGAHVLLWRCANGVEVGAYPTMGEALNALLDPAMRSSDAGSRPLEAPEPSARACPGR